MTYYVGEEVVRGTIIGDITYPYEFWIEEEVSYQSKPVSRRIAKSFFRNDTEAVEWFKENYPNEFKHGVEMRAYDLG